MTVFWLFFILPVVLSHTIITVPDIFLIGCAKCGSTSFNDLIKQSPSICRTRKEFHFFTQDHTFSEYKEYTDNFSKCSKQLSMDASPG